MSKKVELKAEVKAHPDGDDVNRKVRPVTGGGRGSDVGPPGSGGTDPAQDPPARGM